jgi:hypothetical protein
MNYNAPTFKLSWDRMTWGMTIIITLMLLSASGYLIARGIIQGWETLSIISIGVFTILPLTALFAPIRYIVNSQEIRIYRIGPNVVIPLTVIESVSRLAKEDCRRTIRVFGVGGLFGNWGWFSNKRLGMFKAYIGNTKNLVLITLRPDDKFARKIVLSPNEPDTFCEMVQQAIKNCHPSEHSQADDFV